MSLEEKIQPGDVILTRERKFSWGSLPIRIANFFKRGFKERGWTHAAIYVGDGEVVEAFPKGIVRRKLKDSYLNDKYDLLVLRRKKANPDALKQAAKICSSEESKAYDCRALIYFPLYHFLPQSLHFILEKPFIEKCLNVEDAYFCSELAATGLQKTEIYCFESEPHKIMPIDFHNSLWFEIVEKINEVQKPSWWRKIGSFFTLLLYWILAITFPLLLIALGLVIVAIVALFVFMVVAVTLGKKQISQTSSSEEK